MPEQERQRESIAGRTRLLAAIEATGPTHAVDAGHLGEYAEIQATLGQASAEAALPEVAAHLASGCQTCASDLQELLALVEQPDRSETEATRPADDTALHPTDLAKLASNVEISQVTARPPLTPSGRALDPRYAEEQTARRLEQEHQAERQQRLRRIRDALLIAAAVSALLIGLGLVGLAYLASQRETPRLGLTPATAGRAAPNGMECPATHPLKGNRQTMIYHQPGGEFYAATRPEDCFATPADAESAGYRRSQR